MGTKYGSIEVHQFPCLDDNYGFLVHEHNLNFTACIDTPDVGAIENALAETGWKLTHIFNTHHHFDHAGGNLELKEKTRALIIGPMADAARIPGIDIQLCDDDEYRFGKQRVMICATPGHTTGHVVYYFTEAGIAFVGDTLFSLGCGRLFEGTPEQMWHSLQKLLALPDETIVYCAHEYTQSNARFALTLEPQNRALLERAAEIDRLRADKRPTVPTTIGLERRTNPFLRPDSLELRATLGMQDQDNVAVFAETRRRKDIF